jgi:hypothetical protein
MRARIIAVSLFCILALVEPVGAQQFVPLTGGDLSKVELAPFMTKAFQDDASLATFVNVMFKAAIGIGAMLAVLQLARAGFLYMGSDMWHKKTEAKHLMTDAIVGLLILMAVWLVLNQINPQLLNLDVLKGIQPVSRGSTGNMTTDSDGERGSTGGGLFTSELPTEQFNTGTEN